VRLSLLIPADQAGARPPETETDAPEKSSDQRSARGSTVLEPVWERVTLSPESPEMQPANREPTIRAAIAIANVRFVGGVRA
jgi:hypothetical protein